MNIHYLELFYYVARHRGISSAVRHMPYSIQQPAMSTQVGKLEQEIGVRLFERSPFRLTRQGEELFAFVRPFFSDLDAVAERLGKTSVPTLRIGAAELMLREYQSPIMQRMQARHPQLLFSFRSGFTCELEAALRAREIDLAIMPHAGRVAAGLHGLRLLRLPLALLVPKTSKVKTAAELWRRERIDTPLISLPAHEVISRVFQKGLKRLWVSWPCTLEASSLDLITQYVANGHGFGVTVSFAGVVNHPKVRLLPLDGFEPVEIAIFWQGKASPLMRAFTDEAQHFIKQKWPDAPGDDRSGDEARPAGDHDRPEVSKIGAPTGNRTPL